jgi:hypothetical protein
MTIRIHPLNNRLIKELKTNDTLFVNFRYTTHLRVDLSVVGPNIEKPTTSVGDACQQNLKILRRISTALPPRLRTLTIHFESLGWTPGCIPLLQMQRLQDEIGGALTGFAKLILDDIHIDFGPSKRADDRGLCLDLNDTVLKIFKSNLSSLNLCFFADIKNSPPAMPSLKSLCLDSWGWNYNYYSAFEKLERSPTVPSGKVVHQ